MSVKNGKAVEGRGRGENVREREIRGLRQRFSSAKKHDTILKFLELSTKVCFESQRMAI